MSLQVQPLPQQQQPVWVYPTSITYESPPGLLLFAVLEGFATGAATVTATTKNQLSSKSNRSNGTNNFVQKSGY
ncbi:hypothetical protein SESBI_02535 [Sesbania bispinosa]|nr:hypothetical protein SESBI_02535 [Sesbania bispinosa]